MRKNIVIILLSIIICGLFMALAWPFNHIYIKNDLELHTSEEISDVMYLSIDSEIVQTFKAASEKLKYTEIYFLDKTGDLEGNVIIKLEDNSGNVLSESKTSLKNLKCDEFNRINFNKKIRSGRKYKIHIMVDEGSYVTVGILDNKEDDNVNVKLYQAGNKRKGVLACNYIFSSELNMNQTLAYWVICAAVWFCFFVLLNKKLNEWLLRHIFSNKNEIQFWFIVSSIFLFMFSALISPLVDTKELISLAKGIMICVGTALSIFLFTRAVVKEMKSIAIIKPERSLLALILYSIIIRIPMLSNLQRWDAAEYYYRIGMACSSFKFSINNFFSEFRLCGHSNLGFSFLMSFPEFIFPRNIIVMNIWNLILTIIAIVCLYSLFKNVWIQLPNDLVSLSVAIVTSVPLFLGTFSYFNVDYLIVIVFIYMVYCDYKGYHLLCAWNTVLLSQVKETGVVIVAGYWGLKILIQYFDIIRTKSKFRKKLSKMIRSKNLWMIMFSGVIYMIYIYRLGGITGWTQNAEETSSVGWSNDGFNCFGFNMGYILHKLKQFFVLNLSWVWSILLVCSILLLVIKRIRGRKKVDVFGNDILGVVGAMIGFFLFSCLYITYALPRYNIILAVFISVLSICIFVNCIDEKYITVIKAPFTILLVLMVIQTFYNIDPISLKLFDTVNIGKSSIIYADYDNKYYGDALVTNYQYTWLDKAYDNELRKLDYRPSDIVMISGPEWAGNFVGGNEASYQLYWDSENKKRTFKDTGRLVRKTILNDTENVEGFWNKWVEATYSSENKCDTAIIMYVPYYGTDIDFDLKRFASDYYLGDLKETYFYNGFIKGYRLTKKEKYIGLSIADTLVPGKADVDVTETDILEYMKNVGWCRNVIDQYAKHLDVQMMKIIDDESMILKKYDCVDIGVKILDENGRQLSSFMGIDGSYLGDFVIGTGMLDESIENELIGKEVGEDVEVEIQIPEYITDVRDLCGGKMKVLMHIYTKNGTADVNSITKKDMKANYRTAYERVWDAYYELAVRQMLIDRMGMKPEATEEQIDKAIKAVNRYFSNYCAVAQMSKEEYITKYLNITDGQFEEAVERLAWSKLIRADIDKIAADYKEKALRDIEDKEILWKLEE